jgi:predicted metal-binding protein
MSQKHTWPYLFVDLKTEEEQKAFIERCIVQV